MGGLRRFVLVGVWIVWGIPAGLGGVSQRSLREGWRNVLGYLRKVDHDAIKKDLEQIHHAPSLKEAQEAL